MYRLGEVLTMKKPHACGGCEWEIARIGADIKLRCRTCGKFVNLMRDELKKKVKSVKESEAQHG